MRIKLPFTQPEWAWLWRENRPFLRFQIASLFCIAASSAASLVHPLLMKWLIDDVLPRGSWRDLVLITIIFFVSGVGKSALQSLGAFVNMVGVRRMTFRVHLRLTRHVQSRSADFHTRHPVGDLVQRLERDLGTIADFASDALPSTARIMAGTLMAIATMIYLDPNLAAVVLPTLPVFAYARHRFRGTLRRWAENVREVSSRQSSLLLEMLTGAIQIQLLGAERRLARAYKRAALDTIKHEILQRRSELVYMLLSMSIIGLATTLIVGYGGARVLKGELTVGGLVAFYGYVGNIFAPLNSLVGLFARGIRTQISIRRLNEIEQASDVVQDLPDAAPLTSQPRVLTWRDVSFDYEPEKTVLRRTCFQVRAGERITVVGESGSGKSSLLKLVVRLHDPSEGCITLDGLDIRSLRLESLRQAISFVPQDPVLFHGTLRANLRYACPTASLSDMEHAAWIASLTEVIDRLPQRWDTELGRMGGGLSGGERQRVALARAILQRRPILILDEAFSALDSAAERRILSRLEGWLQGRILILVSHRLTAAQWADRVVVLRHGQVVEDASHEALHREGTHYNALWHRTDAETAEPAVSGVQTRVPHSG